ncbi:4611_t:CDS:2 [Funneliformis caledonium]|uniref:4611_t:CDS:1 n=1 Tax=Funneliformis caledonium TaxID=1117310 RepID=A0A9N9CHL1_9GLOM|nr:4611_t:CDS:2 [Funneliformis caledonium]
MISDSLIARAVIKLVAIIYSSVPIISTIYYIFYVINHKSLLVELFPDAFSATFMNSSISVFLHYWLGFELVFHLYFLTTVTRFQKLLPPVIPSKHARVELLNNCLNSVDKFDHWIEGWFCVGKKKAKFDQIHRENVEEWLAWSFFASHIEEIRQNTEYITELYDMIDFIENAKKVKFPEGYNPDIRCIRLTLDPIRAIPRPFIFYVAIFMLNYVYYVILRLSGFEHYGLKYSVLNGYWSSTLEFDIQEETIKSSPSRISYWYYNPNLHNENAPLKKNHQKQQPIVFIHGVGVGLFCYFKFLRKLYKLNRPLFLVELPYVSMRLIEDVPTMEETVQEIEEMLTSHGFPKATFVAHSLGTAVCAWVIKEARKRVGGCVLIDPICFLLHYPHVAYNFVYREPKAANEHVTYLFASRELHISHYFARHFHWFQSVFFVTHRNALPANTHVYVSEHDNIVPSSDVYKYLAKNNISVHMMRGLDHSSYLFRSDWEDRIVSDILRSCNASRRSWYI